MLTQSEDYKEKPKHEVSHYDEHNPQMLLNFGNRQMSFSVSCVDPESYEWLGLVLHRQISELVEVRVKEKEREIQASLRNILGL